MTDVDQLAAVLAAHYGHVRVDPDYTRDAVAVGVLECVLSLNRPYDRFVAPRLRAFVEAHPAVEALADLRALILQYPTPADFSRAELRYNDAARAATLLGVVDALIDAQTRHDGPTERARLEAWAEAARPADYAVLGVRGFGLAGFQSLRMLLGVQTAKPDVHLIRFVQEALGRPVGAARTLDLLEQAATQAGLPLREVDLAIWNERARGEAPSA